MIKKPFIPDTRKNTSIVSIIVITLMMCSSSFALQNNGKTIVLDGTKKVLLIPLKKITSDYIDNSSNLPQIEFNDSYLSDVADKITFDELSRVFKSVEFLTDSVTNSNFDTLFNVLQDTNKISDSLKIFLVDIAKKYSVDFIAIPKYCKLTQKSIHQKNWRGARSGSSYEHPVFVSGNAEYCIDFIYKNGNIEKESIGKAKSGKPLFYTIFKKKNIDKNIVTNTKKRYAPPLLHSLNKAITEAIKNL